MNKNSVLHDLSREELIDLIEIYSKNTLAMDGLWFQSIEKKAGMKEAMFHDAEVWRSFTGIEANKIKAFLKLPVHPGLQGLKKALSLRFYANINRDEIIISDNTLVYRILECRVQRARVRKGINLHPCKPVGIIEYTGFAKIIDNRFSCECISCFPDITDDSCNCSWRFTLNQ